MNMKSYKQVFVVLAVGFFIAPQIAFAAWWNPLSWSVWNIFRPAPKVQQVQVATTTPAAPTATTTKKTETSAKQETPKDNKDSVISSLKKQVADLTQKASQPKVETPKTSVVTLPSGAVVEMDASGNVVRTITATPQQTYTAPAYTPPPNPTNSPSTSASKVTITLGTQAVDKTSAQIEWTTSEPTESKLYLSGGGVSSEQHASKNGYTTKHIVILENLKPMTDYSFQITATGNGGFADYTDGFKTKTPSPTIKFNTSSQSVAIESQGYRISWTGGYAQSCTASGAWSGSKSASGEEILVLSEEGAKTYTLSCVGYMGESVSANITLTVVRLTPQITFSFNDVASDSFSGTVGDTVKLSWSVDKNSQCTAEGNWSGSKTMTGSQNITLSQSGTLSYTLKCVENSSGVGGKKTATISVSP